MKVKNKNRKRLNEPRSKYAQFVQNCLALYGTLSTTGNCVVNQRINVQKDKLTISCIYFIVTGYRYSITETGRELADRLEIVEANFGQQVCGTSPPIGGAQPPVNKSAVPAGQSKKRKEPGRLDILLSQFLPEHFVLNLPSYQFSL